MCHLLVGQCCDSKQNTCHFKLGIQDYGYPKILSVAILFNFSVTMFVESIPSLGTVILIMG